MQHECPICMMNYNCIDQQPLVIGVCGHTVCSSCSKAIERCPFCKRGFTPQQLHKNYALCSIIFSAPFLALTQWKNCKTLTEIRSQNVKTETDTRKLTRQCPQGHQCGWHSIIGRCSKCMDAKTGWKCEVCEYQECDICLKTEFKRGCPNGHSVEWRNQKHRCQSCFTKCQLFHCQLCKFKVCNMCLGRDYKRASCPNSHPTVWNTAKTKCNGCLMYTAGWQCSKCEYNICETCSATERNEKRPPKALRTIRIRNDIR